MQAASPVSRLRRLVPALSLFLAMPAMAASPQATLTVANGGRPVLTVRDPGSALPITIALGLKTTAADLTQGLTLQRTTEHHGIVEHYRMTTGKRLQREATFDETRYALRNAGGQQLDVVLRTAPDGIAFRYELPGVHQATVDGCYRR